MLGGDTLVEDILARLLEREGYNTRILEAYPTDHIDESPDSVDILFLAPDSMSSCAGPS